MGISRMNNNLFALSMLNLQNNTAPQLQQSFDRLTSGLRINRAGDDAAGLQNANRLQSQISGLNQALNASQTGINVANIADGSLNQVTDRLQRVRELTVQAGSGTLDQQARQGIQNEIQQNIDEISTIAKTTQFASQNLLNGDFAPTAQFREGTQNQGVQIESSNLSSRENFLNIRVSQEGSAQITSSDDQGSPQTINAGIENQQDVAVTTGTFQNSTSNAAANDNLSNVTFNNINPEAGGTIAFQGTLADGETQFSGSFAITAGSTIGDLATEIQNTIDQTESEIGINTTGGTSVEETNVAFNENTGRLEFRNGADQGVSQFNIDLTVSNANGDMQNTSGITRATEIVGTSSGAQIGNSVNAIQNNTFDTGDLTLEISAVNEGNRRAVESNAALELANGGAAQTDTSLIGTVFNGSILAAGDTITLNGTNADGSTFSSTISVSNADLGVGEGDASTVGDLLAEFNVRDQSLRAGGSGRQSGFTDATAQLTQDGRIRVEDDIAANSETAFTLTVNDQSGEFGTIVDQGNVVEPGNPTQALASINGGPAQQIEAGQTTTLFGQPENTEDGEARQITLTFGENLREGTDTINVTREEFTGSLNGGEEVQFSAGEQNVVFNSGLRRGEQVTLNFDANVEIDTNNRYEQETLVISAGGQQANFQTGANAGENTRLSFGDVRPQSLGLGEDKNLNDIDITEEGGVEEALQIVNEALSQVDEVRSRIGAFANGLEATTNQLSVTSENFMAARSRIEDADFAAESTRLATNQMILESNLLIQSQTNNLQNNLFLDLLR